MAKARRAKSSSRPDQSPVLKLAIARMAMVEDADKKQDDRERADLSFYEGDGQWPEDIKTARAGQNASAGLPPVPARPCLTINKTREPVRHVLNEERLADLGVEVIPADDFEGLTGPIDATEIELREGLIRRIQRQSQAADARTWAYARATIAGRGYYGLMTRYVEGKTFDQEVVYRRFYNQSNVKLDPAHEMPDGSDAEWAFVASYLSWDAYQAEYGKVGDRKNHLIGLDDGAFDGLCQDEPDWFTTEGETRMVRVVEYWYYDYTARQLLQLADGRTGYADELGDVPEGSIVQSRRVVKKQVKFCKLDGSQILEETDWPGSFIPIVKVVGEEIQPFDSDRRFEGMIRPARDAQKSYNVMVSAEVEAIGLAPKAPFELDPEQIEGFEPFWQQANVRNFPYLPRKSFRDDGRPFLPINRLVAEPPIQAISLAIREFDQAIKSTTGIPDATLGNVDPSVRSGRGIKALLAQAQQGSSHFLDNLVRSIHYEAKILNDLLPAVYGSRPGRLLRIMTGQNETQSLLVGQPFQMMGPSGSQRPVPVQGQPTPNQPPPKSYTLTKDASFNLAVKVSKNYDTRREQEAQTLGDLIAAEPQLMTWFGDLFFKYQDGPGHGEMADRAKLMLAPPIQQMLAGQGTVPPQVQAQMAQMQQMGQQLEQKVQEQQRVIDGKVIEKQADLQKAQIDANTRIEVARINQEGAFAVADLKATLEAANTAIAAMQAERLALESNRHEAQAQVHQATHEAVQNQADRAHELGMAAVEHAQALQQNAQGHAQALEQGQQAAALAPPPADGASA